MFIQTEETPNPNTYKFIPVKGEGDVDIEISNSSMDFATSSEAEGVSSFVQKLFTIEGVERVFLNPKFISITKSENKGWSYLRAEVITVVLDFILSGEKIIDGNNDDENIEDNTENNDCSADEQEILSQIREIIEERVRPAVAMDGGDITFVKFDFETGVVYVKMKGACAGCPSAEGTLKGGIENMLRYYVPEVQTVEPVMEDSVL